MIEVFLVIHLILCLAMVGVVLLQKSEGGGLGMGGGGMSGFMTGRSTANLLTRTTAILAAGFFVTSIALAVFAGRSNAPPSIVEQLPPPVSGAPATVPAQPASPAQPAEPATPSVPLAK